MNVIPMAAGFGARIEDIDLTGLDAGARETLRVALLEHGLLVVPAQALDPQAQIAASEVFGALETFPPTPSQIPGYPQIFRVASRAADGHTEVGRYWHSDGSFRTVPTPISVWHLEVQPEQGGDTWFVDLQAAYRSLPEQIKAQVRDLQTMHRNGVLHPLVIPHPRTGVAGLYLNIGLTAGIVGMGREESAALIAAIDSHFSREGAVYRHQWQAGDFVVADNFRIAHRATPLSPSQRRILNRTTVRGDGAFWDGARVAGSRLAAG
ncbi:TauD/TfdA family dioxygenase [Herbaspirillum sp. RV1423]|uniref:TauD/TfdA dioxygenase family protein n=1 Tax=Herbaspirillum sp. RV1423 TaxID=1443993 RepID=UPI0018CBF7BE|nr:TauD/TfdA family dioxygenase [Herbaspirillum sp. RV1423]